MAFVYVLRSGDEPLFKIGRTRGGLEARIRQLATGNPHRLTLFDHIETDYDTVCETYLHRRLRARRSAESDAREFFSLTPAEVVDAVRDAREFLEDFVPRQQEAERLAREESDGVLLTPTDPEWEIYRRLIEIRAAEYSLNLDRTQAENQLKLVIGKSDGLERLATWKSHEVKRFDEAAFKLAEPKLFEAFVRASVQRKFRLQ